jgi:hypothetical protein
MNKLTKETMNGLIACTITRNCAQCMFNDVADAKVECQARLLEAVRDDLLIPKLYEEVEE